MVWVDGDRLIRMVMQLRDVWHRLAEMCTVIRTLVSTKAHFGKRTRPIVSCTIIQLVSRVTLFQLVLIGVVGRN